MIRNVVLHMTNEQPLLADLFDVPGPGDVGLLCTNVRGTDGKKPVFIDHTESTFFFPYRAIRFLEIPPGEIASHGTDDEADPRAARGDDGPRAYPDADAGPEDLLPIALGVPAGESPESDLEIEIDEDFLQRIRDI